ncbi:MAG: DUF3301 domain-containing protein [Gammaproteobacteria bacterium]|nr:DUF3301 domain-containing protein [Gammaproteobacteria bacterium]
MQQLLILFLLFIVTAYWIDSVQVKELARRAGSIVCKKHEVQFLDNTVVKQKTSFQRHHANLFKLRREYYFEYSTNGKDRESGIIIMAGHLLDEVQMDLNTFDNQDDA